MSVFLRIFACLAPVLTSLIIPAFFLATVFLGSAVSKNETNQV